jgi:hypothetical protein
MLAMMRIHGHPASQVFGLSGKSSLPVSLAAEFNETYKFYALPIVQETNNKISSTTRNESHISERL